MELKEIFSLSKPQGVTAWVFWIFGVLALLLGLVGIIYPEALLMQLGFVIQPRALRPETDYTLVFITASSMASFNMGAYYMFAAQTNTVKFYFWTIPFRFVTVTVFSLLIIRGWAPISFFVIPLWEFLGALTTAWAIWYEFYRKK